MRLQLDTTRCHGHGRCYALAPGLFDSDDDGYAVLLVNGEIPADSQAAARLTAQSCPEYAIETLEVSP